MVHPLLSLLIWSARAEVAPECDLLEKPDWYDEQAQADFLANYPALALTQSAVHAPLPHRAGHGAVGLDLAVIPPLGCGQRFVLDWTKTEDVNKVPVVPRPRATFAFQPLFGKVFPYAGLSFVPPVPVGGMRNTVASAELGLGMPLGVRGSVGARVHGTLLRTVGDVATAFEADAAPVEDLYVASSTGADLLAGFELGPVTPYLSIGLVETQTYFWVGDDGYVSNNYHPYFGPALALGADALLLKRLRVGAELYSAPGGYSLPDPNMSSVEGWGRYGHLTTLRLRLGYEL